MVTDKARTPLRQPSFPLGFLDADSELLLHAHEWLTQDEWFVGENREPALLAVERRAQPEFREALRLAVDQLLHPELLCEALELTKRGGALHQIHEVRLHTPLGEEPQRLARVGVFLRAEDLDLQVGRSHEPGGSVDGNGKLTGGETTGSDGKRTATTNCNGNCNCNCNGNCNGNCLPR